jgi:hypothetical protein
MDYDTLALNRQKAQARDAEEVDDLRNSYGALVLGRPVCRGYAAAYQYLLQQVGIQSVVVSGDCKGEGRHAWNIVKLEGDYYHIDVTWGDGSNTDASFSAAEPNFKYFGLTDREIRMSRTIDRTPPMPACTATACNYFVRSGLYFTGYDHKVVMEKIAELLKEPNRRRVDLRFSSTNVLDVAYAQLVYNGGVQELLRATGRNDVDDTVYDPKFNVMTCFFQPLEKTDEPIKPEECNE